MSKAIHELFDGTFKRIVIIKPIVEADENLGFLPGDVEDKLGPYTESFVDILKELIGSRKVEKLIEKERICFRALAYMRGATLKNSLVILDEAQNTTVPQIRTFLSRLGENAKFIILGDLTQSDKFKTGTKSGFYFAKNRLTDIPGISQFNFKKSDIIRHKLINQILEKLDDEN